MLSMSFRAPMARAALPVAAAALPVVASAMRPQLRFASSKGFRDGVFEGLHGRPAEAASSAAEEAKAAREAAKPQQGQEPKAGEAPKEGAGAEQPPQEDGSYRVYSHGPFVWREWRSVSGAASPRPVDFHFDAPPFARPLWVSSSWSSSPPSAADGSHPFYHRRSFWGPSRPLESAACCGPSCFRPVGPFGVFARVMALSVFLSAVGMLFGLGGVFVLPLFFAAALFSPAFMFLLPLFMFFALVSLFSAPCRGGACWRGGEVEGPVLWDVERNCPMAPRAGFARRFERSEPCEECGQRRLLWRAPSDARAVPIEQGEAPKKE